MDKPLLKIPEDFHYSEAHKLAEKLFDTKNYKITNASVNERIAEKLIFDLWNARVIERIDMNFDSRIPYIREDIFSTSLLYDQRDERWHTILWSNGMTDLGLTLEQDCEYNLIGALKEAITKLGLLIPVPKIDFEYIY